MAPWLSICIPTHDGRRETLADTLDSVLRELAPGVELCVSDNASQDGTEELVAELMASHPDSIRYRRNPRDLGGPANLLAAVEMARTEWCWLLSSDDALMPGGVSAAARVLERHPDVSGFTLGWRPWDRSLRTPEPGRWSERPWNAGGDEVLLRSTADLVTTCGPLFDYMSSHVFRRALWVDALTGGNDGATMFPTTLVLGRIAVRRPRWVWSPELAVMDRMQNHDLLKDGGVDIPGLRARALDDERRVWRAVLADPDLERRVTRRWVDVYLHDLQLHVDATHPDTTLRGQLRLLWSLLRATGRSRWFWGRALPVLAIPAPLGRRLPSIRAAVLPYAPLPPEDCVAPIAGELPVAIRPGGSVVLRCAVHNLGTRTLRSLLPHPVHLAYRWFDRDGGRRVLEGDRVRLEPRLRPGARFTYELPVTAPSQPGDYMLRVSLVQEEVRWFDDPPLTGGLEGAVTVKTG